jgi:very-short-patch-repair endonuclease
VIRSPSPEGRGARGEVLKITRNQPVTREKLDLARKLRKEMTFHERMLWQALRADQLKGLHFRRQQVIAGFVADFYCASASLAVELDGDSHLVTRAYDVQRDHALARLGIRTLRLRNEAVAADLATVLARIAKAATSPLTPSPFWRVESETLTHDGAGVDVDALPGHAGGEIAD